VYEGEIKFIDLFAGIGGFRYGLENTQYAHLGKKSEPKERKQGRKRTSDERQVQLRSRNRSTTFRCVWTNEWDKYASDIYKKHYGRLDTRDITKVQSSEIPDHDLLVGGFPCQAFSIAGKRRGFDDTRGTLFFDIARILKEKQPRLLLLENVKGLLSHDNGRTFKTIISTLVELGYDLQWQVLNSKNFGVPQNRERVFIIGNLRGTPRPKVFPIGEINSRDIKSKQDDSKISRTVSARFRKGVGNTESRIIDVLVNASQGQGIRNIDGLASTLQGLAGGQGAKTGLYRIPLRYPNRNQKTTDGKYSYAVDSSNTGGIADEMKIRRLTPTECERLQGFPDGWTEGISDTQRYKCLGNAVTTNVVTWIGERL
jgi:DNA (cytosine-5)-methyltransferase 1